MITWLATKLISGQQIQEVLLNHAYSSLLVIANSKHGTGFSVQLIRSLTQDLDIPFLLPHRICFIVLKKQIFVGTQKISYPENSQQNVPEKCILS